MLFFGLFWSAITLTFDVFIGYAIVQQTRASGYVPVPATITESRVTESRDSDGVTYKFHARYTYVVNGQTYESDRVRYASMSTNDLRAQGLPTKFPLGAKVTAYHDAANPAEAVLIRGTQGTDIFLTLFMAPFNAVMIGFWVAGLVRLRDAGRKGLAISKRIIDRPNVTIVRTPYYMVLVAFGGGVSVAAFIAIFVVAFGFGGFNPPMKVVVVAWAIALMAGAALAVHTLVGIVSGKNDWVIDDLAGTFSFRPRWKRVTLRIADITAVQAETRRQSTTDGESVTHVVTVRGPEGSFDLFTSPMQSRCEALALWLKVRLGVKETSAAA